MKQPWNLNIKIQTKQRTVSTLFQVILEKVQIFVIMKCDQTWAIRITARFKDPQMAIFCEKIKKKKKKKEEEEEEEEEETTTKPSSTKPYILVKTNPFLYMFFNVRIFKA